MENELLVLILLIFTKVHGKIAAECPDQNENSTSYCTAKMVCEPPAQCYRDVEEAVWKCCGTEKATNFCSGTGSMPGADYEPSSSSFNAFKAEKNLTYFYTEKIGKSHKTSFCPLPFSSFLFGKLTGPFLGEEFHLPANWKLENGKATGFQTCHPVANCTKDQYCGTVRNPTTHELMVNRSADSNELLKFCYKMPPKEYIELIPEEQKARDFQGVQLCNSNSDCHNSSHFCIPKSEMLSNVSFCDHLERYFRSPGAKDFFLIDPDGCRSDEECNEKGISWLTWRCQNPIKSSYFSAELPPICVGYEIMCSESAVNLYGENFGCVNASQCTAEHEGHLPLCVRDPITKESACCYEMASCNLTMDIQRHGMLTLNGMMCSEDVECQAVADEEASTKRGKPNVFWGRCMLEVEGDRRGKCCLADVSAVCHVGRSVLPPRMCRIDTECGGEKEWCDRETGFCCHDFPGSHAWLCPDMQTPRSRQPTCEGNDSDCHFGAGICLSGRCCPKTTREGDQVYVWTDFPWYHSDLPCNDTSDLPPGLEMAYCDPMRKIVVRISRADKWLRPTRLSNRHCSSNGNCSEGTVCVREQRSIRACHTYYDRPLRFSSFQYLFYTLLVTSFLVFANRRMGSLLRFDNDYMG